MSTLQFVSAGLDSLVFKGTSRFGDVAVRIPRCRWISNDNDVCQDSRQLLRQEAILASHLSSYDVPTPKVVWLHLADERDADWDYLVSEYIEHDNTIPSPSDVGKLVRKIHESPAMDIRCVAQTSHSFSETIGNRMSRRLRAIENQIGPQLTRTSIEIIQARLKSHAPKQHCLLHMDIRPIKNVLTRFGEVTAVIDWSNALVGDPALELARIAEYGHLEAGFVQGYESTGRMEDTPREIEIVYRLDAAVMLAIVFLFENPDPSRSTKQVKRIVDLCNKMKSCH